jgi:hypothetical protein
VLHEDMQCIKLGGMLGPRNVMFSLYLFLIQPYHFYAKMPNIMFARTFLPRYESLILIFYSYSLNMFDC